MYVVDFNLKGTTLLLFVVDVFHNDFQTYCSRRNSLSDAKYTFDPLWNQGGPRRIGAVQRGYDLALIIPRKVDRIKL